MSGHHPLDCECCAARYRQFNWLWAVITIETAAIAGLAIVLWRIA